MEINVLASLPNVTFAQRHGDAPEVRFAAMSGGEHGIGIGVMRFAGGSIIGGDASRHLLIFNLGAPVRISCRIDKKVLEHTAPTGNVTLCPAETEFAGHGIDTADILVLSVPKEPLACLSAERSRPKSRLREKLAGCDDQLLGISRDLAGEAANAFSGGAGYWTELTDALMAHLLDDYLLDANGPDRAVLTPDIVARINDYVIAHLDERIDVDTLADLAVKGRSHFPRIFRRSVGMSPHQYVIRLRLRQALRLMMQQEMTLAEVAAATGFVDQSHLCHWVKRIHGVTPAQLVGSAPPWRNAEISKTTLFAGQ